MLITLKDGNSFTAILNGNNYITQDDVSKFNFGNGNLTEVTITEDEKTETYTNMKCTNNWVATDGTHIIFAHRTSEEIANEKNKANIDYIAMMTEVDLDE